VLWRLLLSPPLDGPDNMALDEALMARARRSGETVLRTYAWAAPTLSLGRHQRARGAYGDAALRDAGVGVVRRPTGGRALLHDREITYSVTMPLVQETPARAYERINSLLVAALALLGVPASIAGTSGRAAAPTARPCFDEPSAGELVAAGRKLVGSAQWCDGGALLQHGSILVDDDQASIAAFLTDPAPVAPTPATLRGILGRAPSRNEVHDAIARAIEARNEVPPQPLELDIVTRDDARRLAARYRDAEWTWRR
jgi:lipoyl(octanoyl) transferase